MVEWEPINVAADPCVMCGGPVYYNLGCPARTCSPRCRMDRQNTLQYIKLRAKGALVPRRFTRCKICNGVLDGDVNKLTQICGATVCIKAAQKIIDVRFRAKQRLGKPLRTRTCKICGNVFTLYGNAKTCSVECRGKYYKQLNTNYYLSVRPDRLKKRHCKECGVEVATVFGKRGLGPRVVCDVCKPVLYKRYVERRRNTERSQSLARLALREAGVETRKGSTALHALRALGFNVEEDR